MYSERNIKIVTCEVAKLHINKSLLLLAGNFAELVHILIAGQGCDAGFELDKGERLLALANDIGLKTACDAIEERNSPEGIAAKRLMRATNLKLCHQVIDEINSKKSLSLNCPEFIREAWSKLLTNNTEVKEMKDKIRILESENRSQKQILTQRSRSLQISERKIRKLEEKVKLLETQLTNLKVAKRYNANADETSAAYHMEVERLFGPVCDDFELEEEQRRKEEEELNAVLQNYDNTAFEVRQRQEQDEFMALHQQAQAQSQQQAFQIQQQQDEGEYLLLRQQELLNTTPGLSPMAAMILAQQSLQQQQDEQISLHMNARSLPTGQAYNPTNLMIHPQNHAMLDMNLLQAQQPQHLNGQFNSGSFHYGKVGLMQSGGHSQASGGVVPLNYTAAVSVADIQQQQQQLLLLQHQQQAQLQQQHQLKAINSPQFNEHSLTKAPHTQTYTKQQLHPINQNNNNQVGRNAGMDRSPPASPPMSSTIPKVPSSLSHAPAARHASSSHPPPTAALYPSSAIVTGNALHGGGAVSNSSFDGTSNYSYSSPLPPANQTLPPAKKPDIIPKLALGVLGGENSPVLAPLPPLASTLEPETNHSRPRTSGFPQGQVEDLDPCLYAPRPSRTSQMSNSAFALGVSGGSGGALGEEASKQLDNWSPRNISMNLGGHVGKSGYYPTFHPS